MSNDSAIITLDDGNGNKYSCEIHEIFEVQGQQYALLQKLSDESLVIMRLISRDSGSVFQIIEDEDEFEQVRDHATTLTNLRELPSTPRNRAIERIKFSTSLYSYLLRAILDTNDVTAEEAGAACDVLLARMSYEKDESKVLQAFAMTWLSSDKAPWDVWRQELQGSAKDVHGAVALLGLLGTSAVTMLPELFDKLREPDEVTRYLALAAIYCIDEDSRWEARVRDYLQECGQGTAELDLFLVLLNESATTGKPPTTPDAVPEIIGISSVVDMIRLCLDAELFTCDDQVLLDGLPLSKCREYWPPAARQLALYLYKHDKSPTLLRNLVINRQRHFDGRINQLINAARTLLILQAEFGAPREIRGEVCKLCDDLFSRLNRQPENVRLQAATHDLWLQVGPYTGLPHGLKSRLLCDGFWLYRRYAAEVIEALRSSDYRGNNALHNALRPPKGMAESDAQAYLDNGKRCAAVGRALATVFSELSPHKDTLVFVAQWFMHPRVYYSITTSLDPFNWQPFLEQVSSRSAINRRKQFARPVDF